MQVQQVCSFTAANGGAKRCPGMQRQAQVDGGGIERKPIASNRCLKALARTAAGHGNQMLREVRVNLPWPCGVRVTSVLREMV